MKVNFVRQASDMLPEREPPQSQTGWQAWAYDNLWATLSDRVITIVVTFLLLMAGWNIFDSMVLRANTEGRTQDVSTLATGIVDNLDRLDIAQQQEQKLLASKDTAWEVEQRDLNTIAGQVSRLKLDSLPTQTSLGKTSRILPSELSKRIAIAKSKLPLSADARMSLLIHQLEDVNVSQVPDVSVLQLTKAEQETIARHSEPWFDISSQSKGAYSAANSKIIKILNKTVTAADGSKAKISAQDAQVEIDAVLANLVIDGAPVPADSLMTGPLKAALQFNALPEGAVAQLISDLPQRVIKIRKDYFLPEQIVALKAAVVEQRIAEQSANLTEPAARALRKSLEKELNDSDIFLQKAMPQGAYDNLPLSLHKQLEAVGFWAVAYEIVNAPAIAQNDGASGQESSGARGVTVNQQGSGASVAQMIPRVAALQGQLQQTPYLKAVMSAIKGYYAHDLSAMILSYDEMRPLVQWANSNSGFNYAAITSNWTRMLWGSYPTDKLWRVGLTLIGFILAVSPIFIPATRKKAWILYSVAYPVIAFFLLSGLAIRFYGFEGGEDGHIFEHLFSPMGRVMQAGIALAVFALAMIIKRATSFGKAAGPALILVQALSISYMLIMVWGSILNPDVATKDVLIKNDFRGLLTEDHDLGKQLSSQNVQDQIDAQNAVANNESLSDDERQAARVAAFALKTTLGAARSYEREFANAIEVGEGTFVFLTHVPVLSWGGLVITAILGIIGMAISLPLGIVLAFARQSTLPIVSKFATTFIEVIRGVPLIALLLIVTFVLPKLLPPDIEYSKLALVVVAICIFGAVYQAEVIRGGLQSLPKGQIEAAQAMGLSFWQESRLITLPQALKAVIPAIVNTFIGLFKDTTLVIVVGIIDLLTVVNDQIGADEAWNRSKPEMLLAVAIIFFVLMFSLSRYSLWLEKRLSTGHK